MVPIRSRSLIWPAIPLLIYGMAVFSTNLAATGGQHCVEAVGAAARIAPAAITDFSFVRSGAEGQVAAVLYESSQGPQTAVCHFKGDSHVIQHIDTEPGDRMSAFRTRTHHTLLGS